ncbi:MAG: carboxypeptidase regulatory-like domain-containing protein [Candidatus Acidiferrales bacterium]
MIHARAISRICRVRTQSRGSLTILAALLAVIFSASAAIAQVDRAGLNGNVTDSSMRALPGVRVIAVKNDSGLRREAVCSRDGSYDVPELPVGVYTVSFVAKGFEVLTFENVVQTIGQTRTLNAVLRVSATTQRVEVSASSEQLDKTSDALGQQVEKAQVKELPLDGRNWATLTALAPGAVDTGGSNQRSIRFAGRGRDDDNFTYDGIDATNIINQAQQPYVRLAIPLDTIEEFRANSMLATAESGGTGGPQLAVTSPSGTNQFHGDAFEYVRNNIFDAQEPLPVTTNAVQPPFHLNQFGGSLGGPIARDKTFFFVAYEGYRQILGQALVGFVPSDSFRAAVESQSPALIPVVDAYPEGQTVISPDVAQFLGEGRQVVHEDSGMFRVDHRFSEKTTVFVRANIDDALSNAPLVNSGAYLEDKQQLTSSPANAAIELLHIFSPTLVNEAKFGFNRSTADTNNINETGALYAFAVSGFTTLNNGKVSAGAGNSFSGIDNVTWIKGRHTVKGGIEIRRIQLNQGNGASGTVSFASATAFAADEVSTATLTGALPVNGLRKTQYFGYLQDEFKWRPSLTVNVGARYSFFNIFHEVFGLANPFDFATCGPGGFCGVGASFGRPNYGDLDPRIALAWAPGNSTRTVVRAGFGTYHEDGQLDDQNLPISNEVSSYALSNKTIPMLTYPIDPFLADTTGIISPRDDDRRRKDTVVSQWGLSVQRALPSDFIATVAYVGSEGAHLLTLSETNVVDPLTGTRPYPAFGQVSWRGNSDNSNYQALSVSLRRSFSNGVLVGANYQWSHEIDDGSNGSGDGDSLVPQNVACQACERASGIWDVRHSFNANAVYELPFGPGKRYLSQRGVWRTLAGSWELTSVAMARTGFPMNVTVDRSSSAVPDGNTSDQRPDLVPGIPLTPPGGSTPAKWINPAAFAMPASGTFGDAPRDVFRGPGTWQVDLGAVKRFPLSERARVEFRAECFNVFNHPQYGQPQSDFSAGPGVFGSIISTLNTGPVGTGTPRQLQFALRFSF